MLFSKFINVFKNFKTLVFVGLGVAVFATTITLLSINWNNLNVIYAAGSSALTPLFNELDVEYKKNTQSQNIDLNVLPTGSGSGLEMVATGKKQLGNISFAPKVKDAGAPAIPSQNTQPVSGRFSQDWSKRQLKTITLGWDSIAIIYRANGILDINEQNIPKLYQAFAGIEINNNPFSYADFGLDDNTKLIPYARTGGATKSGTTDSFLFSNHLQFDMEEANTKKAIEVIETGAFPPSIRTTKESNIEAWNQISSSDESGIITYLSGGFVINNLEIIKSKGFKIATYKGVELTLDSITSGYNWYRPLNTICSINVDEYVRNWLDWVLAGGDSNSPLNRVAKIVGIKPITKAQYDSMCSNGQFWISDYQLIEQSGNIHFGAISS